MNPTSKPSDNRLRAIPGGGWNCNVSSWWVRAASRSAGGPARRNNYIGFRTHLAVREPRV